MSKRIRQSETPLKIVDLAAIFVEVWAATRNIEAKVGYQNDEGLGFEEIVAVDIDENGNVVLSPF